MQDHIQIGKIYREHGLKGLCKIYIFSLSDENLTLGQTFVLKSLDGKIQKTKLKSVAYVQKHFLVEFDCFKGADQVQPFRKAEIWLSTQALAKEENEVFEYEWIGLTLYDGQKNVLGKIVSIEHTPLPQFLVQSLEDPTRKILIPWVKEWIKNIHWTAKTLQMDLPEGLNEL